MMPITAALLRAVRGGGGGRVLFASADLLVQFVHGHRLTELGSRELFIIVVRPEDAVDDVGLLAACRRRRRDAR